MPDTQKNNSKTDELLPEPTSAPPLADHLVESLKEDDPAKGQSQSVEETDHEPENDEALAAEDAELSEAFKPHEPPQGFGAKIKHAIKAWWDNPKVRWGTLAGLSVLLLLIAAVPQGRYFVLNTVGVRSSASVVVVDDSTQQPLKNVQVVLAQQTGVTDATGAVKLHHIKLGANKLLINRRAFAPVSRTVVIGLGSNPLGALKLVPTGSQYGFTIVDYLSGKPVAKAEASADQADAIADDQGKIVLTVDGKSGDTIDVTVVSAGYRDEKFTVNLDNKTTQTVKLVPARKHVFVSKRSGKYDVYSVYIDGKDETVILPGTGYERDDIAVVPQTSGDQAAVVSTRNNLRNKDGYLLSTLTDINVKTGQSTNVVQSERVQVNGWVKSRVVYTQVAAGASANNPNRMKLMSYDTATDTTQELATNNYFNDVAVANGVVYYAASDAYKSNPAGFYKINADSTNRVKILGAQVDNILRSQYDHLTLAAGQDWYDYKLGNVTASKLSGPPASQANRLYQDNTEGMYSLWIDGRDGKGVLLNYDTATQKDTVLQTASGLNLPMYWLNDSAAVYRIHTEQETADYVISVNGGQAHKIANVTNSAGLGQWYYY